LRNFLQSPRFLAADSNNEAFEGAFFPSSPPKKRYFPTGSRPQNVGRHAGSSFALKRQLPAASFERQAAELIVFRIIQANVAQW
jgi:hypothetical protein